MNSTPGDSTHPEVKAGPVKPETAAEIEVWPETPEISPEIAEHVERVTKGEIELPGPIEVGDYEGRRVTVQPAAPQQPNIVLPVTQDDFQTGQTQPVTSAFRWLVEWVKWIIKKYPGRAVYRRAG